MAHTVIIKEIINGVQITETIDTDVVVKLISYQSKPFLRTTNETDEETYQVLDIVGEIYNTPALATDFRIIDANDNVFIPANGVELIEYSKKIRAFRPDDEIDTFHIGSITTTSNSLTINLAGDGVNWAYIDGSYYEKYYPDTFNFTPVTTGQKILIVYAKPDSQVFHLAQGAESTEAVEPSYSGLFVARIIVDVAGEVVSVGGGELPPGTDGQIYEIDNSLPEKIKPSDRLTDAENEIADLSINQIEITTTTSITTNTAGTGADVGKGQHMRSVLVKNGVNAINITLETSSHAKFEAIYYKKGSAAITFVAGAGVTLVKVANDGILNGAVDSNSLVYRDGNTFYLYISNY